MSKLVKFNRRCRGQALAETAASMMIVVPVFVLLIAFSINVYFYMMESFKLQSVASETAKYYQANEWWLGMKRQSFDPNVATQTATTQAQSMASQLALPTLSNVSFQEIGTGANSLIVCNIQAPFTAPFTMAAMPLSITTLGVSASDALPPPAVFRTQAYSTLTGIPVGVCTPAYGIYGNSTQVLPNAEKYYPGPINGPYGYVGIQISDQYGTGGFPTLQQSPPAYQYATFDANGNESSYNY